MTLTVTIGGIAMTGDAHFVDESSPSHVNAIGQRDTFSCRIVSKDGSYTPAIGAAVEVSDDAGLRFGGSIREKTVNQFGVGVVTSIQCASWEAIMDRRLVGAISSLPNETCGEFFQRIFDGFLGAEGLTATIVATGPVIEPALSFDWITVREAFDTIASLASGDTDTYMWDCTPAKVTRFYKQSSFAAPFDVTNSTPDVMRPITINQSFGGSGVGYANKAFVRVAELITDPRTNTYGPDGSLTSFMFEIPLASEPTITLDTGSGPVAKTVGIRDVDTGKDFYWQDGSPEITAAVAPPDLSTLEVTAKGYQTTVVDAGQIDDEVAARSIAEDNSGWYVVLIESTRGTRSDAIAKGQARLAQYVGGPPRAVEYVTQTNGVKAGQHQTVDLSGFGETVNATFIIESVTLFQVPGGDYGFRVRTVNGALAQGWLRNLRQIARQGSGGASGGGTIIQATAPLALTAAVPAGVTDVAYSATLIATGGSVPYTFSIVTGSLPAWATLDATTGIITGTPTAAATTDFTARVTDSATVPVTRDVDCSIVISVPGAGSGEDLSGTITSLSATDDTGARWSDPALHAVIPVAIALSAYPRPVTIETTSPQYGRINHGVFLVSGATTINIGARYTGTEIYPPTVADETVTVRAVIGRYDQTVDVSGVTGVQSATVTVHKPGTFAGTGSSTAGAPTLIDTSGAGGAKQWILKADFGLPLADPKFFFARVTRVIGKYVAGVWTPLPGQPTYEGVTGTPLGDWAGPTYFKPDMNDHAPIFGLTGAIQSSGTTTVRMTWGPYSYDPEWDVIRLYLYLGTRQDDGSGGTKTQQSTWPSGAAYAEVTFDASKAHSDARLIDPTTLGPLFAPDPSTGKPTVTTDQSGNLISNPTFEFFDATAAPKDWAISGSGGSSGFVGNNPAVARTGTHYLALNAGGAGKQINAVQTVAVRPSTAYFLAMWWRNLGTDGNARLFFDFLKGDGTYISSDAVLISGPVSVYQEVKTTVTTPSNCAQIRVQAIVQDSTNYWLLDDVVVRPQVPVGPGTEPDGAGGVKLKIDSAAPVTVDGSGNVTLKLSSGLNTDGSGNLKIKNGDTITFDGSGNVKVNAGPGLTINAGGALVPNQGATVGVNASGQLIVPSGSLGLTQFGGVYQPYGFYFGLPSPSDASVPKLIINTADWKIYRNTGGAWSKQADPADLIAGTITALVSLISPSISGGSIVGATLSLTSGSKTLVVNGSDNFKITDSSTGIEVAMNAANLYVKYASGPSAGLTSQLIPGTVTTSNSGGFNTGHNASNFFAHGFAGTSGTINYVKPGGASGAVTVLGGIITAIT